MPTQILDTWSIIQHHHFNIYWTAVCVPESFTITTRSLYTAIEPSRTACISPPSVRPHHVCSLYQAGFAALANGSTPELYQNTRWNITAPYLISHSLEAASSSVASSPALQPCAISSKSPSVNSTFFIFHSFSLQNSKCFYHFYS